MYCACLPLHAVQGKTGDSNQITITFSCLPSHHSEGFEKNSRQSFSLWLPGTLVVGTGTLWRATGENNRQYLHQNNGLCWSLQKIWQRESEHFLLLNVSLLFFCSLIFIATCESSNPQTKKGRTDRDRQRALTTTAVVVSERGLGFYRSHCGKSSRVVQKISAAAMQRRCTDTTQQQALPGLALSPCDTLVTKGRATPCSSNSRRREQLQFQSHLYNFTNLSEPNGSQRNHWVSILTDRHKWFSFCVSSMLLNLFIIIGWAWCFRVLESLLPLYSKRSQQLWSRNTFVLIGGVFFSLFVCLLIFCAGTGKETLMMEMEKSIMIQTKFRVVPLKTFFFSITQMGFTLLQRVWSWGLAKRMDSSEPVAAY